MDSKRAREFEDEKKRYAAFEEQVDEEMRSCSLYNLWR